MIHIKITASNDHASLTQSFESEEISLSKNDPQLSSMIESTIKAFNQPVDEVFVKTKMEV